MIAFEVLADQPVILVLVIVGLGFAGATIVWSARAMQKLAQQSHQLLALARAGRADEARIQARQNPRDLGPMLGALGGQLQPPSPRPLVRDLIGVVGVSIFPALAVLAGWQASLIEDPAARIGGLSASFAALAILLPTAMAATTLVISMGRRGARIVRGAAVQLLARSLRAGVDIEAPDSLRRGIGRTSRGE